MLLLRLLRLLWLLVLLLKNRVYLAVLPLLLWVLLPRLGQCTPPLWPPRRRLTVALLKRVLLGPFTAGTLPHLALHLRLLMLLVVPHTRAVLGQLLAPFLFPVPVVRWRLVLLPERQLKKALPLLLLTRLLVLVRDLLPGVLSKRAPDRPTEKLLLALHHLLPQTRDLDDLPTVRLWPVLLHRHRTPLLRRGQVPHPTCRKKASSTELKTLKTKLKKTPRLYRLLERARTKQWECLFLCASKTFRVVRLLLLLAPLASTLFVPRGTGKHSV